MSIANQQPIMTREQGEARIIEGVQGMVRSGTLTAEQAFTYRLAALGGYNQIQNPRDRAQALARERYLLQQQDLPEPQQPQQPQRRRRRSHWWQQGR